MALAALLLIGCGRNWNKVYSEAQEAERHDLATARQLTEEGFRGTASNPSLNYQFRVLKAELILSAKPKEALQLLLTPPPPELASSESAARRNGLLGLVYAYLDDSQNAMASLEEARKIAEPNHFSVLADIACWSGFVHKNFHDAIGAEKSYQEALTLARLYKSKRLEMEDRVNLGTVFMDEERYDEAVDQLSQAASDIESLNPNMQFVLGNLGRSYVQLGDFDRGISELKEAKQKAISEKNLEHQEWWSTELGSAYLAISDYMQAEAEYSNALALARELKATKEILESLMNLAQLELQRNNLSKAEEYTQLAFAGKGGISEPAPNLRYSLLVAEIALRRKELAKAENLLAGITNDTSDINRTRNIDPADSAPIRWQAQEDLAHVYDLEKKAAQADHEFQEASQTFEDFRNVIKKEEHRMSILDTGPGYDDYIRFLMHHNPAKALQIAEFSRARTLSEGLKIAGPKRPADVSVGGVQASLKKNQAILAYWLSDTESYLWVLTPSGFKAYTLAPKQEIEKEIEAYTKTLLNHQEDPARGQKLYEMLVRPAENLLHGMNEVIIFPNRGLYKLNLETLVVSGSNPHYWIKDVSAKVGASLGLLQRSKGEEPIASGKILVMGAPILASGEFGVLSYADQEIGKVSSHFSEGQKKIVAHEAATPAAYKLNQPDMFDLIHFVTHGTASQISPLDSAIILSPETPDSYKLYVRDIMQIPIHARLVIISACYGAGTRAYAGEGLVGLAWGFLRAGAHQVIAGLWEVDDRITPDFMDQFYDGLKKGSAADALRAAKLKMLESRDSRRFPFYWASLQLYTGS